MAAPVPIRGKTRLPIAGSTPVAALPEISAADLDRMPRVLLHAGRGSIQADVYALEWQGRPAVLKDLRARSWLLRVCWGRFTLARELRALLRAAPLCAAPRPLARIGPDAIMMERLSGKPLDHQRHGRPPLSFFDELGELLGRMHCAGLAHGDMRRANIFVCDDHRPCLLDFASAMSRRSGGLGFAHRIAFRCCVAIDECKFARLKGAYYPEALTPEEAETRNNPPWYLSAGQFIRSLVSRVRRPWRLRQSRGREPAKPARTSHSTSALK